MESNYNDDENKFELETNNELNYNNNDKNKSKMEINNELNYNNDDEIKSGDKSPTYGYGSDYSDDFQLINIKPISNKTYTDKLILVEYKPNTNSFENLNSNNSQYNEICKSTTLLANKILLENLNVKSTYVAFLNK